MNVAHIINSLGSGGAEKLLIEFFNYEANTSTNKHYIYLLSDKNNVFIKDIEHLNVHVEISKRNSLYSLFHLLDLFKFLKAYQPQIVHTHLFPAFYFVGILSFVINDIKFIFTEHSTNNRRMNKAILLPIEKVIYSRFEIIIAISTAVKNNLSSWLKSNNNIIVVYNGINLSRFQSAKKIDLRRELKLAPKSILICMVARFSKQKDHFTVINALSTLPDNVYLLLVGEGPTEQNIKNLIEALQLNHRVIFLGFRNDVAQIYKSVDVAILYSHYEGFGISALEAIASSTPLVVSDTPGLIEVVSEFENVEIANSSDGIRDSIQNLLKINKNNNQVTINKLYKYSIDAYSSELNLIYSRVLGLM